MFLCVKVANLFHIEIIFFSSIVDTSYIILYDDFMGSLQIYVLIFLPSIKNCAKPAKFSRKPFFILKMNIKKLFSVSFAFVSIVRV